MRKRHVLIRRASAVLVVAACGVLWAGAAARAGPVPSFQGLGFAFANDVSADGSTVVGSNGFESLRWRQDTGVVNLGFLGDFGQQSSATSVSADGSVVVGYDLSWSIGSPLITQAYRWENGVMTGLGGLPSGGFQSRGFGVSGDGLAIVGGGGTLSFVGPAFRWTQTTGMVDLGDIGAPPALFASAAALGASANGTVVVGINQNIGEFGALLSQEAFRWENGVMVGLGDLPAGDFDSTANAVSADGSVVVGRGASMLGLEAFRWENGVMVGLGDLPGGDFLSEALAVSADGSVAVGSACASQSCLSPLGAGDTAFMWDNTNGMRAIQDVLVNDLGLDLTGWMLTSATGVSADGSTIAGNGISPSGSLEGWIATIPEPGTAALLALAAVLIARHRRPRMR